MKPILIMKTGSTLPDILAEHGDFDKWIASGLEYAPDELNVVSVYEGEALPDLSEISGVVITGSPALVTDLEDWSEFVGWFGRIHFGLSFPKLGGHGRQPLG